MEELERELRRGPAHPLLGPPSLHASLIQGGKELSTYPERCVLDIERRTVEGEADGEPLGEVRHILDALRREDAAFEASAEQTFARRPYVTPADSPLPALLAEAVQRRRGAPAETGAVAFWTDAAVLGHAGIPTVVFGPGGAGAHALVEYVLLDELTTCRDVLMDVARRFLEGE